MKTSRGVTVVHSFMQVEQNQSFRVGREDREGPNNPPPPVLCIPRSLPFLFSGFLLLAPFSLPNIKHFCVILPHISRFSLFKNSHFPLFPQVFRIPYPSRGLMISRLTLPSPTAGGNDPWVAISPTQEPIKFDGLLAHSNKRELGHQATKLTEDGFPVPVMSAASYPSET